MVHKRGFVEAGVRNIVAHSETDPPWLDLGCAAFRILADGRYERDAVALADRLTPFVTDPEQYATLQVAAAWLIAVVTSCLHESRGDYARALPLVREVMHPRRGVRHRWRNQPGWLVVAARCAARGGDAGLAAEIDSLAAGLAERNPQGTGVRRAPWASRNQKPLTGWDSLTAMEQRVARLIFQGHTNRSAANVLALSSHTVNSHLRAIFGKLGVNSRVKLIRVLIGHLSVEHRLPETSLI